ncbi:MAG TPA: glycosyltransferase [Candidatus Paceibacterota bacterium]
MKFSVIIPTYNPTQSLFHATRTASAPNTEVLIIDDGSTEWPLNSIAPNHRTDRNRGPGAARNVGLDHAQGDWIIFLDSDDELAPGALERLSLFIDTHPDVDAIGYGWEYSHQQGVNQRKDGNSLLLPKRELMKEYLKLRMDGSVIYTAVKRSVIEENNLRFRDGLHEDIDFIFKVYAYAKQTACIPEILYRKTHRTGSIVNTVTKAHIDGFIEGWAAVGTFRLQDGLGSNSHSAYKGAYERGIIGAIATRVREVAYKASNATLLKYLLDSIPEAWIEVVRNTKPDTQYARIAKQFLFTDYMLDPSLFKKTWSCTDLHNSLFLAPDEIRTCCKRFFVDGKMKGDVKLVGEFFELDDILKAKQKLIDTINKGDECECTGCPFMEFKEWGPVAPLRVTYLSMEHHSVCNMKCTYCDDKYYGKKQPAYDVDGLLLHLSHTGALAGCQCVVWGGGEPVLGKNFEAKVANLMEWTTAKHRFLTNALVFSPAIANAIRSGRATVTTSIDAGTEKTFAKVRGTELGMHRVFDNLSEYASINAQVVTIKYILTEDNLDDIEQFRNEIHKHKLACCNFQISANFKNDEATVEQAIAAIDLHWMLRSIGCRIVFFDDLLMQRMVGLNGQAAAIDCVNACGGSVVALPEDHSQTGVVVWGTGGMTDWAIEHTYFLRNVRVAGRNFYLPGVPAVITGSQGYADNYRKALAAGVPEDLIVKGVIL